MIRTNVNVVFILASQPEPARAGVRSSFGSTETEKNGEMMVRSVTSELAGHFQSPAL